jgi:tight adherence protein B
MKPQEYLLYLLAAAAVLFALGFVFYRSVILSGVLALLAFRYPPIRTREIISARRRRLTLQFKDMLYSLSSALSAGSSVEMAMSAVLSDMEQQYGNPDTLIVRELELIVSKLALGQNIEELFLDLAQRSGIDDIRTFAHIFEISKRTGGNLMQIIRQTSDVITEKIETKQEIETILAEKKMEQKVLAITPLVLMVLLTETTGDFMAPLFASLEGRLVCTLALALIVTGFLWGRKLTDIRI